MKICKHLKNDQLNQNIYISIFLKGKENPKEEQRRVNLILHNEKVWSTSSFTLFIIEIQVIFFFQTEEDN